MKARDRKQKLFTEINVTPLADVSLTLLIIFMITTPLIYQSSLKVNLPQAKSGEHMESGSGNRQTQIDVAITNEGIVYLNGKIVTKKELKEEIAVLYRNNPGLSVVLRSDRLVRFKYIVEVLDALNELGITNLNIAATPQD
jgi:biopolymer transport protein ExbD